MNQLRESFSTMEFNEKALTKLEHDIGAETMPLLMQTIQSEIVKQITHLTSAIKHVNMDRIQAESHKLKSTALSVGLDELADIACMTELAALQREQDTAIQLARELNDACGQAADLVARKIEQST